MKSLTPRGRDMSGLVMVM